MQNYLSARMRGRSALAGFSRLFSVMLLGSMLLSAGAKASGMSGTFTIDASGSGNYTTFKAALSDLTTNGLSGPVVLAVTAGTYSETVTVGSISGLSSTNTITFRGAGRGQTYLSGTGTIVTVSAYTNFDQMSIVTTGSVLIKASKSKGCGFTNCDLTGATGGTGNLITGTTSDSLTVYNCEISGGNEGLVMDLSTTNSAAYGYLRCTHNRFVNQTSECIDMQNDFLDSIAFNTFDSAAGTMYEAVYMSNPNGLIFWGNKVLTDSYDGIDLYDPDLNTVPNHPAQSYFVNNWIVISDLNTNNYEGTNIDLYNCSNFTFAFNTYVNDGAQDESAYLGFDNSTNITFASNIFYGTYSGYDGQFFLDNYGSTFKLFDGNDVYCSASTSSNPLCVVSGASYNQYYSYSDYASAMQANGFEMKGTNVAPPFVYLGSYPYDLHMSTSAAAPKGVACGISTDIDGKGRFQVPTAGASESYYGITNDNAGVTALVSPIGQCPGTVSVSVVVTNLGLNDINSGVTIAWSWNNSPQGSVSSSQDIPLFGSDTIVLGTETLSAGVSYSLLAYPVKTNGKANAGGSQDTLSVGGIMAALGSGTYTIDGSKAASSSNFTSFTTAAAALNAGICGPVVFNVSAAKYNESIAIGEVPGASTTNTVVFRGAGRSKTTLTNSGVPISMNGSGYVTFDQMTISTTGNGNVIKDAGTMACAFTNDNLTAPTYSSGSTGNVIGTANSTALKVNNCRLFGGEYSYYVSSNFDTFTNNRIIGMGYCSIYAANVSGNDYEYNVVDSVSYSTPQYGMSSQVESGGNWNGNYFYMRDATGVPVNVQTGININEPNSKAAFAGTSSVPMYWAFTNNAIECTTSGQGIEMYVSNAQAADIIAFNTFKVNNGYQSVGINFENNNTNTLVFANNLLVLQDATYEGWDSYFYTPGFMSGISSWDNSNGLGGNALYDGNDIISTGTASTWVWGYGSSGSFNSFADYQNANHPQGWELNSNDIVPNFLNTGNTPLYLDTTKAGPPGVNICTPVSNSFVNYPGVQTDITGRRRCALFPTAGAYEDPFGKAPVATKIYVPTSGVFPNSPATIYQSHTSTSPAIYTWYIENSNYSSWYPVSTSVDLYYKGWTSGSNKLKLVTQSCTGIDSDSVTITVKAPTAVPVTDFIASANTIQQNTSVQFTDLSSNGPTTWLWKITPDSITVGSTKLPTTNQYDNGNNLTQNPNVTFMYPGFYQVCLTAYNGLGKGGIECKSNFINVVPAVRLSSTVQTITTPTGYIFDNGGPDSNYTAVGSPYIQGILIAPCADSIYLTFSQFDTKCGTDFVKLYNSNSPDASKQINNTCGGSGTNSLGPGFNGGPTNTGCTSYCVPNINRPDTFKAGKTMYLTMSCYTGNAPGFAAYYWVKPNSDKKVMPSFTTASGDTVCAGQIVNYINTTTIDPADVPSFQWDLNGDISDGFECTGACTTAIWPYFLPGTIPVTLIAINCGGADTLIKNITIISPPKPVAAFTASILAPTTSDVDVLTSTTAECVDNYKWKITPSTGNTGGAAPTFVNGTSSTSQSPEVTFPDTGYYDVSLYVDNSSGSNTNTLVKTKYIHVRNPYCIPAVASLSKGVGISHVVFNTIDNYTLPQASAGYLNFTSDASLSTDIAIGASYNISISRDPNSNFSPINRDVYIDWNQDGFFTGSNETVAKDSDSKSVTYTAKITVPTTATLGATVMRIATNLYLYPNVPCGPNQFGEFQDYRVNVTKYNILPVITLKGISTLQDTIKVEQGYPYVDAGDSASSYLYGNITKDIVVTSRIVAGNSSFNILIPGTYVFSYNVTDAEGNKAITKYRIVKVTPDKTPPALKIAKNAVSGTDTIYEEVTANPANLNPPLSSYVISSIDLVDGNLTASVYIDSSLVQTTIVGVYPVTYSSSDISNPPNTATKTVYVDVIDTIKPVLTLKGANPYKVEVNTQFNDPGVTITIPNNYFTPTQVAPYLHVVSSVDETLLGTYTVTYSLTDTFGNRAATVVRTVIVEDTTPPAITVFGPLNDSIPVFNKYVDPGYTFSDNYTKTGNIKFTVTGTFFSTFTSPKGYASKIGGGRYASEPAVGPAYTIIYTATDGAGNTTTVTRYVEVYDNVPPAIQLIGSHDVTVCRWYHYIDLGYTLSDNYDNSVRMISAHLVDTLGDFFTKAGGTNLPTLLYLQYTAMDQSHNVGASAERQILVVDAGQYPCYSGIEPNLTLDKYINIFPNPSSGIFTVEANLPTAQNVRITVMDMLGKEIGVVHNGMLTNNSFKVDLSSQPAGVYFLNIVTDKQTLTKRIEVSK